LNGWYMPYFSCLDAVFDLSEPEKAAKGRSWAWGALFLVFLSGFKPLPAIYEPFFEPIS